MLNCKVLGMVLLFGMHAASNLFAVSEDSRKACARMFSLDKYFQELREHKNVMHQTISAMQQPLAHGTDSNSWKDIVLVRELRFDLSTDGVETGALCLSDLKYKDGLLASYGFAAREKWEMFEITSPKSVVKRYSEVNPFFQGFFGPFLRFALQSAASEYLKNKSKNKNAYPVYLIFDGRNEISGYYRRPKIIPSEFWVRREISLDYLKVALVPSRYIEEFKSSLEVAPSHFESLVVLPLEVFELE